MSRSAWNFLVDAALGTLLLTLLAVSSVVYFVFPAASAAGGWTVWGLPYDSWSRLQMWAMIALATMALIHLILHWTWVSGFVVTRLARIRGGKVVLNQSANTLYGVGLLIAALSALGLFILAAHFGASGPPASQDALAAPWNRPLVRP